MRWYISRLCQSINDFFILITLLLMLFMHLIILGEIRYQQLKLINNSSSKGNHDHDSVWISDLNISVDFYYFISSFFPQFWLRLKRYIKQSRQCFITFPNTLKFIKNSPLRTMFSTIFSISILFFPLTTRNVLVLGNVVKHGLSYLIYYFFYTGGWSSLPGMNCSVNV